MTESESQTETKSKDIKLYSSKAVRGATFLGGPLAAGYLISENFKALNKPNEGRKSLIIGIIATIVLFTGIFMILENIMNKMPRQLILIIYTGIILGIVEWKQGDALKVHKKNGNSFFSGWRAAGIGLISLLIMGVGILGYIYIESSNPAYEIYDSELAKFSKNENETLVFYEHLNTESNYSLLQELESKTIPKWKENIEILNNTNSIEGLRSELLEQNKSLLKYSELRIKAFELYRKGILENTDIYYQQLEKLHLEIDNVLDKLN